MKRNSAAHAQILLQLLIYHSDSCFLVLVMAVVKSRAEVQRFSAAELYDYLSCELMDDFCPESLDKIIDNIVLPWM